MRSHWEEFEEHGTVWGKVKAPPAKGGLGDGGADTAPFTSESSQLVVETARSAVP